MTQQPVNEFQIIVKAVGYFRTHWWLFLAEIAVIYGSALNNYYATRPIYESSATILIDNSRRQMYQTFMMPGLAGNSNARKQNMAHLLTSQEVMERLRNQLTEHYNQEGRPGHLRLFFPGSQAVSANELRNWITLNYDRNSDIYSFTCQAENADAAHDLCLAYMNTIQIYYPEIGQRDAMMKRDFLSRQISSLTRQIAEREFNLADFQKKSPDFMNYLMLEIEERGKAKLRHELSQLREQLTANRAMKNLLLNAPSAKRGEHQYASSAITSTTARINELQYQLRLMENSTAPDREERIKTLNDEISSVSSRLAELNDEEVRNFLKNPLPAFEVRNQATKLELEYRVGIIKVRNLEKNIEELTLREKKYQQPRLEYERLKAELNHRKKLLNNLYNKEQETELELSAGNAEVFRLQEPTRNMLRVAPVLSRYLYGSLSLCLFVLVVSCIFLMAFFPRLDSEAEVNRLNLPVIGKVPLLRRYGARFEDVSSFGLEYLKIMNYRILRETKDLRCPIIVITSAHAREGKSTVSQLLTLASQSPNRKTLLMDGDLLTNHVNKFFGIQEDHTLGMRGLVMDGAPVDPKSLIVSTVHDGISFMPRGERLDPISMPNFLKPIERVLQDLRKQYDIIYIDTPPLFASNLAHQWAGLADLVVIVGRLFVTRPKDILEAIQTCKIFSKAPVGVALNCVPISGVDRRVSNYYFSKRKSRASRMAA